MIVGLGIDLIEIERIRSNWERFGKRFPDKILTQNEQNQLNMKNPVPRLAALFAGKEAAVKALGTGFSEGIHFKCIEIVHAASGKPEIAFIGKAKDKCHELGVSAAHITLTHSRDAAAATVVLET